MTNLGGRCPKRIGYGKISARNGRFCAGKTHRSFKRIQPQSLFAQSPATATRTDSP